MPPLTVVTSWAPDGYARYGRAFLESFRARWPSKINLLIYVEDGRSTPPYRPISEVAGLADWMDAIRPFPVMSGDVGGKYAIRYDARMARKPFIEAHACKTFGGKVFWIDADTFTFADVPEGFLDEMLPDDKFCCYLGRDWYYTESGFIGFNAEHPLCRPFFEGYLSAFRSGFVFTLPHWHDCMVFDTIRRAIGHAEAFVDLAAGVPKGTMHPFVNSALGRFMDHRKGKRKGGRSTKADLTVPRSEAYWA